jgi:hypothetical protein
MKKKQRESEAAFSEASKKESEIALVLIARQRVL